MADWVIGALCAVVEARYPGDDAEAQRLVEYLVCVDSNEATRYPRNRSEARRQPGAPRARYARYVYGTDALAASVLSARLDRCE